MHRSATLFAFITSLGLVACATEPTVDDEQPEVVDMSSYGSLVGDGRVELIAGLPGRLLGPFQVDGGAVAVFTIP